MKQSITLLIAIMICTLSVFAEDTITKSPNETPQQTEDKKWSITFQPVGVGPNNMSGAGLNLGLYLDPKSLVQLELTSTNSDAPMFIFFNSGNYDIKAYSAGVHYKQFVGNSFYFNAGLDYRKIDYKYESYNNSNTETFIGESSGISAAIGNQWVFNRFTIGCDWVGFFTPLSYNIYNKTYSGSYTEKDVDSDAKNYVKRTQIMITRVYLGLVF